MFSFCFNFCRHIKTCLNLYEQKCQITWIIDRKPFVGTASIAAMSYGYLYWKCLRNRNCSYDERYILKYGCNSVYYKIYFNNNQYEAHNEVGWKFSLTIRLFIQNIIGIFFVIYWINQLKINCWTIQLQRQKHAVQEDHF